MARIKCAVTSYLMEDVTRSCLGGAEARPAGEQIAGSMPAWPATFFRGD